MKLQLKSKLLVLVLCSLLKRWLLQSQISNLTSLMADSYFSCRKDKTGSDAMVLADCSLPAVQLMPEITPNDAFNVCAISLGCQRTKSVIVVLYRAPRADYGDTKALFVSLENICARSTEQLIIVGDFNLPSMVWSNVSSSGESPTESLLCRFMSEHMLTQLAYEPIRQFALLDLIFVSPGLTKSCITNLPPVSSSDHSAQMLTIYSTFNYNAKPKKQFTDYQILDKMLSQIIWVNEFERCSTVDDYANVFTAILLNAINLSYYKPLYKRDALPKNIIKLIHLKRLISRRSTVTNMFHFDAAIAAILSKNHVYDVISVDFTKAFDKAPHHHVLEALARVGISNRALQWFGSFLSERTQQVRVGDCLPSTCDVTSGAIQSSTLGPVLYTILIDPLL